MMTKLRKAFDNPATWRWLHGILTLAWLIAIIPTLIWWSESVLWVALMSCWANAAGHFGALQGAKAEQREKDNA